MPSVTTCSLLELLKLYKQQACKSPVKFKAIEHILVARDLDRYVSYWHVACGEKHFWVEGQEDIPLYLNTELLYFSNTFGDFVGISANPLGRGVKAVYSSDGQAIGWSESLLCRLDKGVFTVIDYK